MFGRFRLWKTVSLLALLFTLSARVINSQPITLTLFAPNSDSAHNNFLLERTTQFTQETGIGVDVSFPSQYNETTQSAFASGTSPDVFLVDGYQFPFWADMGYIQPGDEWIESPGDFYPALLDAYTMDESTRYCAPYEFSALTVQYNITLFEEAGVTFPSSSWTWDDMSVAAQQITNSTGVAGLALPPELMYWAPFIFANDDELIDGEGITVRVEGSETGAISFYLDLFASGAAIDPRDLGFSWAGEAFGAGEVAMIVEGNWIAPFLIDNYPESSWNIVELPMSPINQHTTVLFSSGACVSSGTSYSSEAWQLVNFLTDSDGALAFAEQGFAEMPGRWSAIDRWTVRVRENFDGIGAAMDAFAQNALDAEPWTPHTTASGSVFLPSVVIAEIDKGMENTSIGKYLFAWTGDVFRAGVLLSPLGSADDLTDGFGSSMNSAQETGGSVNTFDSQFLGRDVGACSRRPRPCYCYKG